MLAFQANLPTVPNVPINSPALIDIVGYLADDQEMFANNSIAGYNFYYPER